MQGAKRRLIPIATRKLRAQQHGISVDGVVNRRHASQGTSPPGGGSDGKPGSGREDGDTGAFSRRLEQMTEEGLESGGRSARNAVDEAGFSEDLKKRLEEKIASASFKSENASAFSQASMPASAGRGTRDIAAAEAWTGTESVEDAALRMLTDAHKPLRAPARVPGVPAPQRVDTGRSTKRAGTGTRLASARDRSSAYAVTNDPNMSAEERERLRAELKARFQPAARTVPATIKGLASLANERIEDAIARGQFKNLPRGKMIERDYNASNPFLDTTEYFMNKMIQKQEIVPPWIEKQQELVSNATRFRGRLRADWRRHVARSIASRGGSLEQQMWLADEYAAAERIANPTKQQLEQINAVDGAGHISQITLAGELRSTNRASDQVSEEVVQIIEQTFDDDGNLKPAEQIIKISASPPSPEQSVGPPRPPSVGPFRDTHWEKTEASYLRAAVDNLNNLTRSYNLMAPDLAKKPYFSLDRELRTCFADVAPTVSKAIQERALAPKIRGVEVIGHKPGGVLDKFAMDRASHVHDERKPQYGFKEFWRDLFASRN